MCGVHWQEGGGFRRQQGGFVGDGRRGVVFAGGRVDLWVMGGFRQW